MARGESGCHASLHGLYGAVLRWEPGLGVPSSSVTPHTLSAGHCGLEGGLELTMLLTVVHERRMLGSDGAKDHTWLLVVISYYGGH